MLNTVRGARKNGKRQVNYNFIMVWLISLIIFFVDFFIKKYLASHFACQTIPIIENIFHITVVFNTGAAFGILRENTSFLVYVSIIFILFFFIFMRLEKEKNLLFLAACGMILGGALSNLYDRIILGFVVDYIDLRVWPVFNLSDSCITVGAILLFLNSLKPKWLYKNRE